MNSLPIVEIMHIFKKDGSGRFIVFKERHWINTFLFEGSVKEFHWKINKSCYPNLKSLSIRKRTTYMTYNSTLTKVFVYLLTSIEAIYQTSVPLEIQNRKNVHLATSDCLVITCYLWGVLHFMATKIILL